MKKRISGTCLCGNVVYEVWGPFEEFHMCHCSRCRKDTGSAHASNLFTAPGSIEWKKGADQVKRYDLSTAEHYSKAFCTHCGSPVPCVSRSGKWLIVPAGPLDDDPEARPQDNIWWRDRAPWYDAGVVAKKYTEEPPY